MGDHQGLTDSLQAFLRPGMHALDIGAHAARFANVMAKAVGSTGKVVAVEPDPQSAALLQKNPLLTTVQAAAGAVEAPARDFWVCASDRRQGSLVRTVVKGATAAHRIAVPVVTVDAVVTNYLDGRVEAIKVDTQGSDDEVLRGASRTLADPRLGWLGVEVWPEGLAAAGDTADAMYARIEAAGFVPERSTWAAERARIEGLMRSNGYLNLVCVRP